MAKTETQINLKINKGTYEKIQENLNSIQDNELILTTDKTIPVPTNNDNGKFFKVVNGDYSLKDINGFDVHGSYATVADSTALGNLTKIEGALAYNQADDKIYMCDGTNWSEWSVGGVPYIALSTSTNLNNSGATISLNADQKAELHKMVSKNDGMILLTYTQTSVLYVYRYSRYNSSSDTIYFGYFEGTGKKLADASTNKSGGEYSTITFSQRVSLQDSQLVPSGSWSYNTSSDNRYPSCKAVYDFVNQQTKYKVVNDYSALPTSNLEKGMLVYCKTADANDHDAGFYFYNGSSWEHKFVFNEEIVRNNNANFDPTQTYTLDIRDDDFFNLVYGGTLVSNFNDGVVAIKPNFVKTGAYTFNASSVIVYNNTQYIATINIDLSESDPNSTLSFSEISGGGGSASESFTKFKLHIQHSVTVSDPQEIGPDKNDTYNDYLTYIIPNSKQEYILTMANELLQSSYTSIDQLFTFINTAITSSGSTDATLIGLYCLMAKVLSNVCITRIEGEYQYRDNYDVDITTQEKYFYTIETNGVNYIYCYGDVNIGSTPEYPLYIQYTVDKIFQVEYEPYSFGGGGSGTSEKYYKWELSATVSDFAGAKNKLVATISEAQMQEVYSAINTAMSTNISTPAEIITIYNSIKNDDLSGNLLYFGLCGSLFANVCQFSMESGKPTYMKEADNGYNMYPSVTNPATYNVYTNGSAWFVTKLSDVTLSNCCISFDANSTLTITEV